MPLTVLVPMVLPPEVQDVGAVAWGPKTVKVTVPVGLEPPERVAEMLLAVTALPAVPLEGPVAEKAGETLATTVSDIVEPQGDVADVLFPSLSVNEAYHQ